MQNEEAFKWFEPFLEAKEAQLHTCGSLCEGSRIWVLAKLNRDPLVIAAMKSTSLCFCPIAMTVACRFVSALRRFGLCVRTRWPCAQGQGGKQADSHEAYSRRSYEPGERAEYHESGE